MKSTKHDGGFCLDGRKGSNVYCFITILICRFDHAIYFMDKIPPFRVFLAELIMKFSLQGKVPIIILRYPSRFDHAIYIYRTRFLGFVGLYVHAM